MDCFWHYESPLGPMTLASDGSSLTGLWFDGQKHFGSTLPAGGTELLLPVFRETVRWLDLYYQGCDPGFVPPVAVRTTSFRKSVLDALSRIPYGTTTTYSRIASDIAEERGLAHMSAQAVGQAVARNPVCLIIPCHRVVAAGGSLTGYAGGIERKRHLLLLEGIRVAEP